MTPLFIELCAGTAALSLRLHHPRARPPVSRMGAKTGFADVILRVLGLRPGGQAARYLWAEPDAGVRLLLHALTDRHLALAAAAIIRGWQDEDPRALWERLRAEGPAQCPPVDAREVARFLFGSAASYDPSKPWSGFLHPEDGGRYGASRVDVARKTAGLPTLPATITDDARAIDPPQLLPGSVVYMDPPYQQTTGYAHDLSRLEVIQLARRWQAAGAKVCISEAEPIPELLAAGWHAVEITGERKGQKRTFSKQQREWLTLSHAPAWKPSVQVTLFGGAS
jgi:hypothetical protein